jgi:Lrp/AsnC family leucine-responsive transcriptional regulator
MVNMKPLDSIDRRILSILQKEGRVSNVQLAKRVHLSPTPCLERIRRLERDGFIRGYRAELDPDRLGCGFVTFMTVSLDRTTEDVFDKFACSVARIDEIVECHMVGGGFDYLLKIRTESMSAFRTFMGDRVSSLPEVAQTHSYFVMEEVKDSKTLQIR